MNRFDKAIRYVMENEDGVPWDHDTGEFTNDSRDPGGATMWGIIKTEYEGFLGHPLSIDDVKSMARFTAIQIYNKNFWVPIKGNAYIADSSAIAIMDTAVNKGLGGCMVILTDACHQSFVDRYTDDVLTAVNKMDPKNFLDQMVRATTNYINARLLKYPNMSWAKAGWMNRANRLETLLTWNPQ